MLICLRARTLRLCRKLAYLWAIVVDGIVPSFIHVHMHRLLGRCADGWVAVQVVAASKSTWYGRLSRCSFLFSLRWPEFFHLSGVMGVGSRTEFWCGMLEARGAWLVLYRIRRDSIHNTRVVYH